MSIVFEPGRSSYLADESYPNIDQASEEVERYDEADNSNDVSVSDVMHDVVDLGVPVTVSYHPPEQSILAESEPRVLDVGVDVGSVDGNGVNSVDSVDAHSHLSADLPMNADLNPDMNADMNSAAAAAVASIAAAEAEVARARAAQAAAQHQLSAAQLQSASILAPSSPNSLNSLNTLSLNMAKERVKPITKPDRDAQKNAQGLYQCSWPNCPEDVTTFNRKCEYNKHMDKHERPYQCTADGCHKLPGFTYSGGLLRHEREVHGKHGGPRNPLHCPHPTCKRHSGKGFSRAENLNEHLRRVHTMGSDPASAPGDVPPASTAPIMSLMGTAAPASSAVSAGLLASDGMMLGGMGGLSNVLRSIPLPTPSSSRDSTTDDNNSAAAAVAAAAANAVAGRFSPILGVADDGNAKSMEDSIDMLLQSPASGAPNNTKPPPRGRKRSAGMMGLGDSNATARGLREEMKRLRQENQEQRHQLDLQKQQTNALLQQINALRQLVAQNVQVQMASQAQAQAQAQAEAEVEAQGEAEVKQDEPASPTTSSLQGHASMMA